MVTMRLAKNVIVITNYIYTHTQTRVCVLFERETEKLPSADSPSFPTLVTGT